MFDARHHKTDRVFVRLLCFYDIDKFAAAYNGDFIGQIEHFVKFEGNEQYGVSLVALRDDLFVNVFDRTDIESARRLNGDEQFRFNGKLAADDELLLVSAGKFSRRRFYPLTRANVKIIDDVFGV